MSRPSMAVRRALFTALCLGTIVLLVAFMAAALAPGGLDSLDIFILVLFALWLPWIVIGFWNAIIGFVLMRFARDPVAAVVPQVARVAGKEPITTSTAILICIRNEPPARIARNIVPLLDDLEASGEGGRFHIYILSDTSDAKVAKDERTLFDALRDNWAGRVPVTYRLREVNTGFKAGNVRDFCERFGKGHDFMITLDADSVLTAAAALRMVRIMQADPKLGILQALVVGLPSSSAFARVFQFGMRLGMRSFTLGSAWWQGDCGPYWGHNAIIRIAPFTEHCHLPVLSGRGLLGGHILSHDQIEAVMMRRAGFDVRVLPEENLGWEENPPTLTEFVRRDVRWCQGNMQYFRLVGMPGIRPVSRFQIGFAILMYFGSPIWITFIVIATYSLTADHTVIAMRPDLGAALFLLLLVMSFAPKIATMLDVLLTPALRRAFGGGWRFLANTLTEFVFTTLLVPITSLVHTLFLARLLMGQSITWGTQARDGHEVPFSYALQRFWPQTLVGVAVIGTVWLKSPQHLPYALFAALGLAISIPFAVASASAGFGRLCTRLGFWQLPEERQPPDILRALKIPALEHAAPGSPMIGTANAG